MFELRKFYLIAFILLNQIFLVFNNSYAKEERYVIDNKKSFLNCSVNYMVVPKIKGFFKDFSGEIFYDHEDFKKNSVVLKVETSSLDTENKLWNKIIKSKRILGASEYPQMVFRSINIYGDNYNAAVEGVMDLHGVSKKLKFNFIINAPVPDDNGKEFIKAKGTWIINRKDFNIFWHKVLDKSGIVVGNMVILDWEIVAFKDNLLKY